MLLRVLEDPDDVDAARKINALHAPASGVIVTHAQGNSGPGPLADDILWALGRPAALDAPRTKIQAWAAAWLTTARPRCQLIVYGAHRLSAAAIRWLTQLADNRVNVWLVAPKETSPMIAATAAEHWPWTMFLTRPWHEPAQSTVDEDLLLERDPTPEWGSPILPPYPFARKTIAGTPTRSQTYRSIVNLHGTYEALWPVMQGMLGRQPYSRRDVLAVVARIALVSNSAADLSVLLRALEEDVFMADGLLVTDPTVIANAIRTLKRDVLEGPAANGTLYDQHADPNEALLDIYAQMRFSWPQSTRERGDVTVANDGSQFIPSTGEVIDIPPWQQWQARAALATHTQSSARIARSRPKTVVGLPPDRSSYSIVSIHTAKRSSPLEYSGLIPIIEAIRPGVAYCRLAIAAYDAPVEAGERHHLAMIRTPDAMPLAAALCAREFFDRESIRSVPHARVATTEGLEWLLEHGLAEWDQHRRKHMLVGWFFENLKARTGVHVGPRLPTRWI